MCAQSGNLSYYYDANGRVTSKGGTLASINLPQAVSGNTFNPDNEMTGFNGTTLTYDSNGNLTSDGTNTYSWDVRNHLTAISGVVAARFVYDAFGRRMSKAIGATITQDFYDGLNPVQELDGSNPPNVTANLLTGLGIDQYFTRTASSTTSTLLADALGSAIGLVTANNGSIATSYTYQPFGATTASGTANGNAYQFTGRENDGTGLYFYRARYYSPTFQRFMAQDPLDFAGGDANVYAYVGNDPADFVDPMAQDPISGAIIGTIVGAENGFIYSGGSLVAAGFGALGGGTAGALVGLADPTGIGAGAAAGALGGLLGNGIGQSLAKLHDPCRSFNWGSFVGSGLGGAGVGAINGAIPAGADNALLAKALTGITLGPLGPGLGIAVGGALGGR